MEAKKFYDFNAAHLAKVADDLGLVKAEIAELKKREKGLEKALKDSNESEVDGDYYRVTVSRFEKTSTSWKKIAEKMKASAYMVKTYSKVSDVVKVCVKAHKK